MLAQHSSFDIFSKHVNIVNMFAKVKALHKIFRKLFSFSSVK